MQNYNIFITERCTIVHSAVLRLHVVHLSLSVCLSVRTSVTLVDQDHIGWKSWKLIAQTINPSPSLFVTQRPSTYSQWNMEIFGRNRAGVGKSGVLEHRLKR